MSKKENKKGGFGQIVSMIIMLGAGAACGVMVGELIVQVEKSGENFVFFIFLLLLFVYLVMFIQIVVHESGHLVFGLLSGYKFSSFRIGSLMFIKENGKMKIRKFSIAGTGGQCLMSPPDLVDGKMPVVLYNLGGCIMNLISSAIFAGIAYFTKGNEISYIFSMSMVIMGVAFALTNGIPMSVGLIVNDGHNAFSLGKNPVAMKAFWIQLKANEQLAKGKRLKDMPADWFAIPEEKDMDNGMVAAIAVFHANWLLDQRMYKETAEYIKQLLEKETAINGLHKNLLICDRIYCELIANRNISEAIYLHGKEYEKFVKQMKNTPGVIRTEYAYALICEKDEKKANKLLKNFDKIATSYPYPSEISSERELIKKV